MTATEPQEPFVMLAIELQDLVAEGKLTMQAAWLYGLLLSHINYKRGDTKVWPPRSSLARRMRLKHPRAVDRYITELAEAGLIEVEHRRNGKVNDTNVYTLKLVCWPKDVVRPSALGSAPQNTRGSALENTRVVRSSTPELDRRELDEEQLDKPSSLSSGHEPTVAAASVTAPQPREREAKFSNQDRRRLPERLIAKRGWNDEETVEIAETIESTYPTIEGNGWWIVADQNGTLDDLIKEAVKEIRDYREYLASESAKAAQPSPVGLLGNDPWASYEPSAAA